MTIRFRVSLDKPSIMLTAGANVFSIYFKNFWKYCYLLPLILIYSVFYGVYVILYGFVALTCFVQDGGVLGWVFLINNIFLKLLVYPFLLVIHFVLYMGSLVFSLAGFLLLWLFFGLLFLMLLPSGHYRREKQARQALEIVREEMIKHINDSPEELQEFLETPLTDITNKIE